MDEKSLKWVDYKNILTGFCEYITYRFNGETTVEFSSNFKSNLDLEESLKKDTGFGSNILSSSGSEIVFEENIKRICNSIERGECLVEWVTCENEASRIDLHFSQKKCKVRVYENVIGSEWLWEYGDDIEDDF